MICGGAGHEWLQGFPNKGKDGIVRNRQLRCIHCLEITRAPMGFNSRQSCKKRQSPFALKRASLRQKYYSARVETFPAFVRPKVYYDVSSSFPQAMLFPNPNEALIAKAVELEKVRRELRALRMVPYEISDDMIVVRHPLPPVRLRLRRHGHSLRTFISRRENERYKRQLDAVQALYRFEHNPIRIELAMPGHGPDGRGP